MGTLSKISRCLAGSVLILIAGNSVWGQKPVSLPESFTAAEARFRRYQTTDSFRRPITFYVTENEADGLPRPLALFILGSGAYSQFLIQEGKILTGHRDFLRVLNHRARLLVVEKVGVRQIVGALPKDFGTALGATPEFRREHTLDRWTAAISAALLAARTLPGVDPRRTLVVGHSEGAQVAASVAARNDFVTHVACLNGAGPTQLFDFLREGRAGKLEDDGAGPEEQVRNLLRQWALMRNSPGRCEEMWHGHSYCYWATFMASSALEELPLTHARIFLAGSDNGIDDERNMDLMEATLLAHGKDVTTVLVKGGDHAFQLPDHPEQDGWSDMHKRVADWFFSP